jgi:hypothetical protein
MDMMEGWRDLCRKRRVYKWRILPGAVVTYPSKLIILVLTARKHNPMPTENFKGSNTSNLYL